MPKNYRKGRLGYGSKPRNKRYSEIIDDLGDKLGSNSEPTRNKQIADDINMIARKDMYKSSYAIKVDPYKETNQASTVYNFISKPNKSFTPGYKGDVNLDGGYTSQYLTSLSSGLLHIVDATVAAINLNYRFLNLNNRYETAHVINNNGAVRGSGLIRKMYDAVNEAVSQLDSTTFTYLAMSTNYAVISDVDIPDVDKIKTFSARGGSNKTTYMYVDVAAVILLTALEYQITMLNGVLGFNYVNKLKFYEAELLKMNYDRETTPLNDLFGQIMKSTFTTQLHSIILALKGEYVDASFIKTMNMITQVNSREADDMVNPVKEVIGYIIKPDTTAVLSQVDKENLPSMLEGENDVFTFLGKHGSELNMAWLSINEGHYRGTYTETSGGKTVTKTYDLVASDSYDFISTDESGNVQHNYMTLKQAVIELGYYTSMTGILFWARNLNYRPLLDTLAKDGGTHNYTGRFKEGIVPNAAAALSATGYYNRIRDRITAVGNILDKIKTSFTDLRTVLDKLSPIGLVNWFKNVELQVNNNKFDSKLEHFIIIDDIYKSILGGPEKATFQTGTGRWSCNTYWDLYEGIPEYDKYSGGAFITLSGKTLDVNNTTDSDIEYLPRFYTLGGDTNIKPNVVIGVNRLGSGVTVSNDVTASFDDSPELTRLAILPIQREDEYRTPYVVDAINAFSGAENDYQMDSWLARQMMLTYGVAEFNYTDDESVAHKSYLVNPTIIGLYTYEIISITKSMISYAKNNGPLKGTTGDTPDIGFAGLTLNK